MPELPRPSDFELAILRVLWHMGEGTVRRVYESLQAERKLGYTTVPKPCRSWWTRITRADESARAMSIERRRRPKPKVAY